MYNGLNRANQQKPLGFCIGNAGFKQAARLLEGQYGFGGTAAVYAVGRIAARGGMDVVAKVSKFD